MGYPRDFLGRNRGAEGEMRAIHGKGKLFLYIIRQVLYNIGMKVLLCSASPRRRELLHKLVKDFSVTKSDAEERSRYQRPHLLVMDLAREKGRSVMANDALIIASDTLVYRHGRYYGKPKDRADAFRMLRELSGVTHAVYTGVYLKQDGKERVFYDKALVHFHKLTDGEINDYLDRFAPFDKAGAYGIQDGIVVKNYTGSFDTIMGLPTEKLGKVLEEMGVRDVYQ
ncbi:MAG TPA: septum formation protein Maf [Clostridiales bacterium]|nr:septum formation protein Maf [Clostridiales bacterium]